MRVVAILLTIGMLSGCDVASDPPPAPPPLPYPAAELSLQQDKDAAVSAMDMAANDLGASQAEADWDKTLCAKGRPTKFQNWVGKIEEIGAPGILRGASVTIDAGDDVHLETPIRARIDQGTPLYAALTPMNVGQAVQFSGEFLPEDFSDCPIANVGFGDDRVRKPHLSIRLTSIAPLELQNGQPG